MVKASKNFLSKLIRFIQIDIWRIRTNKVTGMKSLGIRQLRIILIAARGFVEDNCKLRASALTFFSLLSIVPVVAMAFGVAKGFGIEKLLEKQLYAHLQGQEEIVTRIINFSNTALEQAHGGVIAGIGIMVLFWSVIGILGNTEKSFNNIWGVKKTRPWGRKFTDYLAIMLICPVLLIASSSVTVLISSQVKLIVDKLTFLGPVASLILAGLNLLPYAVLWVVFTYIYVFLPNTKVKISAGIMGGVIAGTIYQLVQWAYINFQIGVSKYGAIYGSFAALPLFLVWLQIGWMVVLLGAEVSFAEQNVDTYEFEPDCLKASLSFKRLVSVAIMHQCVKRFHLGDSPLTAIEIAHNMEMPIRLVRQVLFDLTQAGLLSEVKSNEKYRQSAYQPAKDIENISVIGVLQALDDYGIDEIPIAETEDYKKIKDAFVEIKTSIHHLPENALLKKI